MLKGGRRFSFNASVVYGDGEGRVGYGLGKAGEIASAIKKGTNKAKKNMRLVYHLQNIYTSYCDR